MGIRVHKVLGYGLTDVECKDFIITDPRFTDRLDSETEELHDMKAEAFVQFVEQRMKEEGDNQFGPAHWTYGFVTSAVNSWIKDWSLGKSFIHQAEFGLPNVFVVIPIEETHEWRRYDNMIDYIEEIDLYANNYKDRNKQVRLISRPLYPYDNWMNAQTGDVIKDASSHWQMVRYFTEAQLLEKIPTYLEAHGYSTEYNFRKTVVPIVPYSVRLLCEWAGIFKDPKTALQLRPMIYVYWS